MVSPEILRRYELFAGLSPEALNAVAMLTEDLVIEAGDVAVESGDPAEALYVLRDGDVELYYVVQDEIHRENRKEIFISEINPGDPFGISALIEPYRYVGTIRARTLSRVLRVDARGLRAVCEADARISHSLLRQLAKAALARLQATEVQLGAARA